MDKTKIIWNEMKDQKKLLRNSLWEYHETSPLLFELISGGKIIFFKNGKKIRAKRNFFSSY